MTEAVPILGGIAAIGTAALLFSSAYVVDEGRVGVITNMGKAVKQETPSGLQFMTPLVSGIREFDVRERALPISINAATSNQLNTTAAVSFNWRPDPARVMEIFVKYGSPDDFATNVLLPRLAQSSKATIGKFSSVQLTQERNAVAEAILTNAQEILEGYPAIISSAQVEDFSLPQRYWEAVLQREEQREVTERERLLLDQQRLQAQREVQTAEAQREATKAKADGEAYAIRAEAQAQAEATRLAGEAEADAITAKQDALEGNPLYVELIRAQQWNGQMPGTIMGAVPDVLMQFPTP